jgi:hypothetical protein
MRNTSPLLLVLSLLVACDHSTATKQPAVPADLDATGTYALSSPVEVPPTVLASQTIVDYLALLRLLKTDPAAGFFQLLDEAGVPMASELFAVLPSVLKDQLKDAINDYVGGNKTDGGAGSELDRILAFSETAFARFTLESQLTVPPGAKAASVVAAHGVQGLVFELPGGLSAPVPRAVLDTLTPLPGALEATPSIAVVGADVGGGDAGIEIGDHAFGLAYGEIVFAVLDGYGTGVTLRSRLGGVFDCAGMGKAVANRCVLGVCIGHASDITAMCESALDLAVDKLHDELAAMNFDAVHFAAGDGQLWDRAGGEANDGLVSRIDSGVWQASIDVGTGARDCKATFTGRRL